MKSTIQLISYYGTHGVTRNAAPTLVMYQLLWLKAKYTPKLLIFTCLFSIMSI